MLYYGKILIHLILIFFSKNLFHTFEGFTLNVLY